MRIRPVNSDVEIAYCATLMSITNPWKRLQRSKEMCEKNLRHDSIRINGAVTEKGLVGFLASMRNGVAFAPLIEYLCVDEEHRNKGIGTRLIKFFESELYPAEKNLFVFVSDTNPHAQRLYQRLGYMQMGAMPNYGMEGQTEFLFRKTRGPKNQQKDPRIT